MVAGASVAKSAMTIEDNRRQAEATGAILQTIKGLRVATPETIEQLQEELLAVLLVNLEGTGA